MSYAGRMWALSVPVTGPLKSVLLALAIRADDDEQCYPKVATISRDAGVSERAVQGALSTLCRAGLVAMTKGGGRGNTKSMTLVVGAEPPPWITKRAQEVRERAQDVHERAQEVREKGASPAPQYEEEYEKEPEPTQSVPVRNFSAEIIKIPRRVPVAASAPSGDAPHQFSLIPGDRLRSSGLVNGKLEAFQKFWELYPARMEHGRMVKPGKWKAEQVFARVIKAVAPEVVIAAVQTFPFNENPKYIQKAENWLAGGNFGDDVVVPVNPDDANPFAALHRMHAEHARDSADDAFAGTTIDAELEDYPHG